MEKKSFFRDRSAVFFRINICVSRAHENFAPNFSATKHFRCVFSCRMMPTLVSQSEMVLFALKESNYGLCLSPNSGNFGRFFLAYFFSSSSFIFIRSVCDEIVWAVDCETIRAPQNNCREFLIHSSDNWNCVRECFCADKIEFKFRCLSSSTFEKAEANKAKLASVSIRDKVYLLSKTDEPTNIYEENIIAISIKQSENVIWFFALLMCTQRTTRAVLM